MSATLGEAHDDLYRSLNVMLEGDAGPVLAVWSNSDDVTYGGPFGGFLSGRDAVVEAFEASAAMVLGGSIEVSDVHMLEGADVGYSVHRARQRSHDRWSAGQPGPPSHQHLPQGRRQLEARAPSHRRLGCVARAISARHGRDICTVTQVTLMSRDDGPCLIRVAIGSQAGTPPLWRGPVPSHSRLGSTVRRCGESARER